MSQPTPKECQKLTALPILYKGFGNAVLWCSTIFLLFIAQILLLPSPITAQSPPRTTIKDATTQEAVAFANIQFGHQQEGTVSDINGQFNIPQHSAFDTLRISCLGYQTVRMALRDLTDHSTILLKPVNIELSEVRILPGENPAHQIIRQVINHRPKNNPDLNTSYRCLIYHKMTFGMEMPDTLPRVMKPIVDSGNSTRTTIFCSSSRCQTKNTCHPTIPMSASFRVG
jgi:hypothetical protein